MSFLFRLRAKKKILEGVVEALPPRHTCNHLPLAFIQVRGNHVPHGRSRTPQKTRSESEPVTGVCVYSGSTVARFPNRTAVNSSESKRRKLKTSPREREIERDLLPLLSSLVWFRALGEVTTPWWQAGVGGRGGEGRKEEVKARFGFRKAGHTFWKASLVQRVKAALLWVWPRAARFPHNPPNTIPVLFHTIV